MAQVRITVAQRTSTRSIPRVRSWMYLTVPSASGAQKEGQPQCESNFSWLVNSSVPQARHW